MHPIPDIQNEFYGEGATFGWNSFNTLDQGITIGKNGVVTNKNISRDDLNLKLSSINEAYKKLISLDKNSLKFQNKKREIEEEINKLYPEQSRIAEKMSRYNNFLNLKTELNNQQKELEQTNSNIANVENQYNLSDKSRIYEYENFYQTLNKLNWSIYGSENGNNLLAHELRDKVAEFNPNIANKYGIDKYKEIVDSFAYLNTISKSTTIGEINKLLNNNNTSSGPMSIFNFAYHQVVDPLGLYKTDYHFFDIRYKDKYNNDDGAINLSWKAYHDYFPDYYRATTGTDLVNSTNHNYGTIYSNMLSTTPSDELTKLSDYRMRHDGAWRYDNSRISDEYLNELTRFYNSLDNTTNYSRYITRNTLLQSLKDYNNSSSNLNLNNYTRWVGGTEIGADYLETLYANFGEINLVDKLLDSMNPNRVFRSYLAKTSTGTAGNEEYKITIGEWTTMPLNKKAILQDGQGDYSYYYNVMNLNTINDEVINEARRNADSFITAYDSVDLSSNKKNVENIEETRNLFKPWYNKMIELRHLTDLYQGIQTESDPTIKKNKQAEFLNQLKIYRDENQEVNKAIERIFDKNSEAYGKGVLNAYTSYFVRPYVKYSSEFVNHFKNSTKKYIDILNANKSKLFNFNYDDEFIREISEEAHRLSQQLDNLKTHKSSIESEINRLNTDIANISTQFDGNENALEEERTKLNQKLDELRKERDNLSSEENKLYEEETKLRNEYKERIRELGTAGNAIAIGDESFSSGESSVAIGPYSESTGDFGVAIGYNSVANATNSVAIGKQSNVTGENSIAIGSQNIITGSDNISHGNNNNIKSNHVIALGSNITVGENLNNSVVLGNNSTVLAPVSTTAHTIANTQYQFAGTSPIASVSIGSDGKERTLTHLAAGRISNTSTDGINGSQLNAVIETLNNLNTELTTLKNLPQATGKTVIKGGEGISVNVAENGEVTINNTSTGGSGGSSTIIEAGDGINVETSNGKTIISNSNPFTNAERDKLTTAFTKSSTALQKENLISGEGVSITTNENGLTISSNLSEGTGISLGKQDNRIVINNNHTFTAGEGIKIDRKNDNFTISATGAALAKFSIAGDAKIVREVTGSLNIIGDDNISTDIQEDGKLKVSLKDTINLKNIRAGNNILSKTGLKIGSTTITQNGINAGNHVINNVKDGEIAPDSKQAINGGQLVPIISEVINHSNAIQQLSAQNQYLNQKIDNVDKKRQSSVAGVIAMTHIPQAVTPGAIMIGAGFGNHQKGNAIAIGASIASDNGNHTIKTSFSVDSSRQLSTGVGYGFRWR